MVSEISKATFKQYFKNSFRKFWGNLFSHSPLRLKKKVYKGHSSWRYNLSDKNYTQFESFRRNFYFLQEFNSNLRLKLNFFNFGISHLVVERVWIYYLSFLGLSLGLSTADIKKKKTKQKNKHKNHL